MNRPDDATPTDGPAMPRPVDVRDYVDFGRDGARRVRIFATDRLAYDVWCIEPQQATPVLHLPETDVTYTVVGGRSWFVTDDGEIGLDPMGAMLVPAGVVHGIDNRAPDPLIVLAVSAPPSADSEDEPVASDAGAIRDDHVPGPLRRAVEGLLGINRGPD
jgi:mannose-6-phosphate isomerase-like protein (cupin superfamily)